MRIRVWVHARVDRVITQLRSSPQPAPVLGFAAFSGTGKTTLLRQLVPLLRQQGLRLGLIKHAHHRFDVDQPGKDSYELRHAGAERVLIGSRRRWALMVETPEAAEPRLADLLPHMDASKLDLILVEGFKHERFPKIELHRRATTQAWLYPQDSSIIAVATDAPETLPAPVAVVLDLNQPEAIARFILHWLAREYLSHRRVARR
jgi:molybdopterin-guanine dinucleotide biosynthesis protein B